MRIVRIDRINPWPIFIPLEMLPNWSWSNSEYGNLIVLGGVFFSLLICVVGVLLYAAIEGIVTGGTASLAASLLLVLLTAVYAFFTLWMAHETRRSRQQEIQPVLEFRPREYGSTIVNLGSGPARNIDVTLTLMPDGESHSVQWQSLPSGQEIMIPAEPFSSIADREYLGLQLQGADIDWETVEDEDEDEFWDEFDEHPYEQLHMEGFCEDVWGNQQSVNSTYEVWNLTEAMVGTVPSTMDEESSLELIATKLNKMRAFDERAVDNSEMRDKRHQDESRSSKDE